MAYVFRNVRVFDGRSAALSAPCHVLIQGNRIERIASQAIEPGEGVTVIDGGGRTLMPGLIDAHWHAMLASLPMQTAMLADIGFLNLVAGRQAEATLLRGFTSVRDMGGPVFGLKRAIDEGIVPGPRIWPAGAFITQTGGHGDFRLPHDLPRPLGQPLSYIERIGLSAIADSPDEVRLRAREQLMLGASHLKLMTGGGASSLYDPLEGVQFTEAEVQAAVEAAANWGTYVAVHVYTVEGIRLALAAGVRSIEHGHLVDEATAELMAEHEVWWCLQPFLADEDSNPQGNPVSRQKQQQIHVGTETAYELARKYHIKTAFGTDILFDAKRTARQGAMLAKLTRWYTSAEVLRMATGDNAQCLALSGPRSPYAGKLGVVEEGALADLLLVDGDPLTNLGLIADPHRNFVVIMKDGRVVKNTL